MSRNATAKSVAYPQTKVSASDWLDAALRTLISEGVEQIRILKLASKLNVSRSSFYWYFRDREDLLSKLLEFWRTKNTNSIVAHAAREAVAITGAVLNLFECWVDDSSYDPRLDFAVREWARRSREIKEIVGHADDERVAAIAAMFRRFDYAEKDALIRGRIVYYMQIGYYSVDLGEPMEARLSNLAEYVRAFTGVAPTETEVEQFVAFARAAERRTKARK